MEFFVPFDWEAKDVPFNSTSYLWGIILYRPVVAYGHISTAEPVALLYFPWVSSSEDLTYFQWLLAKAQYLPLQKDDML
jgi:hypothetical protein